MAASAVILIGMCSCKKVENSPAPSAEESQTEAVQPSNPQEVDEMVASYLDKLSPTDGVAERTKTLTTTPSGLKYRVIKEGTGKQPEAQNEVEVNYEGRTLDGKIFDSSYDRKQSITFPLSQVIPGWTEGLQYMKEGGIYEFYIPYNLAYGDQANPNIPAKSDLLFKVELISVK